MQELLKEAFDSYRAYLSISGILDTHEAKLSLLKWPDIAAAAIDLSEKPDDESLKEILRKDLDLAVLEPIKSIHEAAMERIKELSGNRPVKAQLALDEAEKTEFSVDAKRILLRSLGDMFTVLNTMTNVEYPEVNDGSTC